MPLRAAALGAGREPEERVGQAERREHALAEHGGEPLAELATERVTEQPRAIVRVDDPRAGRHLELGGEQIAIQLLLAIPAVWIGALLLDEARREARQARGVERELLERDRELVLGRHRDPGREQLGDRGIEGDLAALDRVGEEQ
ncbi:MAG: hypothetical protein IPQ07_44975 [Myxococcales bacterium]|nr:hypothetical protein [Myxococcales bacterium]